MGSLVALASGRSLAVDGSGGAEASRVDRAEDLRSHPLSGHVDWLVCLTSGISYPSVFDLTLICCSLTNSSHVEPKTQTAQRAPS